MIQSLDEEEKGDSKNFLEIYQDKLISEKFCRFSWTLGGNFHLWQEINFPRFFFGRGEKSVRKFRVIYPMIFDALIEGNFFEGAHVQLGCFRENK